MEGVTERHDGMDTCAKDPCSVKLEREVLDRWLRIKESEGLHSDSDTALLLLKCYESHHRSQWYVQCVYCQTFMSVTLACGRSCDSTATLSASKVGAVTDNSHDKVTQGKGHISGSKNNQCDDSSIRCLRADNIHVNGETGLRTVIRRRDSVDIHFDEAGDRSDEDTDVESHFEELVSTPDLNLVSVNSSDSAVSANNVAFSADDVLVESEKQNQQLKGGQVCPTVDLSSHSKMAHNALSVHYEVKTSDERICFECITCRKSFPSENKVKNHVRIHSERPYCEFCQKYFKTRASLSVHRHKFHTVNKAFCNDQSDASHTHDADLNSRKEPCIEDRPFTCTECGLSFKKSNHLSGHKKQAHSQTIPAGRKKSLRCRVCHRSFKFNRSLISHMKSHSKGIDSHEQQETSQDASQCDQRLPDREQTELSQDTSSSTADESQQAKTQSHSTEHPFHCSGCGKTFKLKKSLENHMQKEHMKLWPRAHKCDKCEAVFRFKTQLTKHRRSHRDERPFSCGQCAAKFKSAAALSLHKSWHEDMRSSVCHLCGQSCMGMKPLMRHMKMKHNVEHMVEKPYKCTECTASFSSLTKLTNHVGVHSHQKTCVCEECGQAFGTPYILQIHMRRHTGERPFQCSQCPESFIDKTSLKRHQLQHEPMSRELCHICGAGFPTKAHLAFHIQRHTTERPFKCNHCGKAYKTTGDLKTHMKSHTDYRPFQCPHCSYAARIKPMLDKHMRKHTGERPFKCEQCLATFGHLSCLSAHRRRHSDTKPFVCEVCGAAFFTAYNLRIHSRKHSGERPYKCPLCPESFSWHSGLKCHMKKHPPSDSGSGDSVKETLA